MADKLKCGNCGHMSVTTRLGVDEFPYGSGPNQIILTATVTIHSCSDCGMEYLGPDTEAARERAIALYFGEE